MAGLPEVSGFWHYLRVLLYTAFHTAELPWKWILAQLGSSLCWPCYGNNKYNYTRFWMLNEKNHLLSLATCVLVIMTLFMLSTLLGRTDIVNKGCHANKPWRVEWMLYSSPFQGLVPSHISCINGGKGSQRYITNLGSPMTNCVLRQLAYVPAISLWLLCEKLIWGPPSFQVSLAQWNSVDVIGCIGTVHKCPNGFHSGGIINGWVWTPHYRVSTLMHCTWDTCILHKCHAHTYKATLLTHFG